MNAKCGTLLTDLYELTMLQGYWQDEMHETAVFEFFVRNLPKHRNFLLAAGLEQAIQYLETFAFSSGDIEWLGQTNRFQPEFVKWLRNLQFTGDVNAMPEGTVFFANEPILQVIAPLPEAQFVETRLINLLNFQTMIASKATPGNVVLLIDTYDTEAAAEKVVNLTAGHLRQRGIEVKGVRIDSGDLGSHARKVRQILDDGGQRDVQIFASGNLDEYLLRDLIEAGAPIDGFGVGTRLDTSSDAPYLDCAYKLQEYGGRPCRKRSEGKTSWPGQKQVYRTFDSAGHIEGDVLTVHGDRQEGEPLLCPVMRGGKRLNGPVPLSASREHATCQLRSLPERLRSLGQARKPFKIKISDALQSLALAANKQKR